MFCVESTGGGGAGLALVGVAMGADVLTGSIMSAESTPLLGSTGTGRSSGSSSPVRENAWIAAPMATTSSGLISVRGSRLKNSFTFLRTRGILVEPPTRIRFSREETSRLASFSDSWQVAMLLSTRGSIMDSNFARVILNEKSMATPPGPYAISRRVASTSSRLDS